MNTCIISSKHDVENILIRIYLGEAEFFNVRVKFISVLLISAQTIYNTA